jgi:signal recognition particle receptor subunit beta
MVWLPEPVAEQLQELLDHSGTQRALAYLPADLQAAASTPEGAATALLLTLALGLLLLLALGGGRSRRRRSNTVVLAGPVNAGKSSLFFQLTDGSSHNGLVASMQENAGAAALPGGRSCRLLDIPGHHSFRHRLDGAVQEAAAVVFVVDAVEITPHRVEAAEMLYELLSSPAFVRQRTPLLVACNKADLEEEAHSVEFIRKTLDKQLDALRRTKAAGIGKDAAQSVTALGPLDAPFRLAALRSRVVLAECSAKAGQLDAVKSFIGSCV